MLTMLFFISHSIVSITGKLSFSRNVDNLYQQLVRRKVPGLHKLFGIENARNQFETIVESLKAFNLNLNLSFDQILRMISNYKKSNPSLELMAEYFDKELVPKLLSNKELLKPMGMERTITQMILNTVLPRKGESVVTNIVPISCITPERQPLTELLESVYEKERQTHRVYQRKLSLRQKIYSLLCHQMKEKIDLFLIGSSLTHLGSNSSDTDLCLIIYDSEGKVDPKYEMKDVVLSKLEELREILESNGMSLKAEVIPALVPILKFIETTTGEVNINVNRVVTIKNTHLLHTYSRMDKRVAQLILTVKLWAKTNGINSAFNKSLTSYSISLMVIHFLQSVCSPPVVPCLQKAYPQLFSEEDVTQLRLTNEPIQFRSCNTKSLGQLFTHFFEYYSLYYNYNKVISVRSGTLLDKDLLISRPEANGRIWQWKCHICIEEPFIGTNTSHAVHDCPMFREIVQKFIDTYHQIVNGFFIPSSNGLGLV